MRTARGEKGQIALETMLVVPLFLFLFTAVFELAYYMLKGELFVLSSFSGSRSLEVQGRVIRYSEDSAGLEWDEEEIGRATRTFVNRSARFLHDGDLASAPGVNPFLRPQAGSFRTEVVHNPLTGFSPGIPPLLTRDSAVVLQPQYLRHGLEDNCLPGEVCCRPGEPCP